MTPQIETDDMSTDESLKFPDKTYKINEKNISGNIEGLEAIEQAVKHILMTERYSNPIYDDNYGVELEQYIGKDISIIEADIGVTLTEALTQDDRITGVEIDKVEKVNDSSCRVTFTVFTTLGNIKEEINVIQ